MYASATALMNQACELTEKNPNTLLYKMTGGILSDIDGKTIFEAAKKGDVSANEVVDRYLADLGIGIANIINIFRPEIIILGGRVTAQKKYLTDQLQKHVDKMCFGGVHGEIYARLAREYDVAGYRNLALNVYDQHQIKDGYPHAAANVETRGETVFAAQNAIDGVVVNCHGEWPYQSWGIDRKEDAKIKIEFGRLVEIDRIVLYTRADFPHDNWWKSVNFTFSDESELEMELEKSALPHEIEFPAKRVSWLEMNHMVKSEELSPFPALTQIEVSGREIKQ